VLQATLLQLLLCAVCCWVLVHLLPSGAWTKRHLRPLPPRSSVADHKEAQ